MPERPPLSKRFLEFAGSELPPLDDESRYLAAARIWGMA
jgi:hypothetical protein